MSDPASPSATAGCDSDGALGFLNCGSGAALNSSGATVDTLLAAIGGSAASFAIQFLIFALLRLRLSRIYRPRSYLVPERERVPAPPRGVFAWLGPLFTTPNLSFIQKCGLDAYFFLRYLRMLLKLFLPIALIVLPILLPINRYSGVAGDTSNGLDRLSISNVAPRHVGHRLWAHLILAIGVVAWFCYVVYKELRGYIRVRQAYLTSPQHRIRASATTVLVTGIPRKWLTLEALSGLYDVFPGGIKNIWINRNFDELSDKVKYRTQVAKDLEGAETSLIKLCRKKHEKDLQKKAKEKGAGKTSKTEQKRIQAAEDAAAEQMAQGQGTSAGDQHSTPHGLQDVLHEVEVQEERQHERDLEHHKKAYNLGVVGQGLDRVGLGAVNQGLGAVGAGFGALGKNVGTFGRGIYGDVEGGFHKVGNDFNDATNNANNGMGFVTDDNLYRQSVLSQSDGAPTPPPKTPVMERDARFDANRRTTDTARSPPASPVAPSKNKPHPLAMPAAVPGSPLNDTPTSDRTLGAPSIRMTRPSVESRPRSGMEIEEPAAHRAQSKPWEFWKNNDKSLAMPSPQPHTIEEDEFPLNAQAVRATGAGRDLTQKPDQKLSDSKWTKKFAFWKSGDDNPPPKVEYPVAINKEWDEDQDEAPRWRRYIEPKDRATIRMPVVDQSWFPALPFVGKKIDKIYHLRRELARLNLEIEADQNDVEKFPFMNSAFIQFNHQVAAHMCCQSLSHHVPQQMAPRQVEISPDDVIWDNMSIKWWERYLRTALVLAVCAGLIVLYAIPVTFTSLLSKVHTLAQTYTWLAWLNSLPKIAISIIQGLLPALLLSLILILVPIIFRALIKQQGVATGNARELEVQKWYFAFLFIQVFFVVTIAGGLTAFFSEIASQPNKVVSELAENLPKAADYFFSYLMVQALSNSASGLLQTGALFFWFVWAPLFDSTARAKWRRQTKLNNVQWGTFFPPFTNFAVIGIIYSIIAPLILVFMLIIFALFWIVYRYNVLYVYQFRNDTGGLLFPTAINQLFTGIYLMEICLIGFFFISQNRNGNVACIPQGAVMIVVAVFTALYQWQLNRAFDPLFKYLPITLEDEAVVRDEEFARAQVSKFAPLRGPEDVDRDGTADEEQDIQDVLAGKERREEAADEAAEAREMRGIAERRRSSHAQLHGTPELRAAGSTLSEKQASWHHTPTTASPTWKTDRWRQAAPQAVARLKYLAEGKPSQADKATLDGSLDPHATQQKKDVEAQHTTVGDVLFSGFADELEDLTSEERDLLVRYAFQHAALRAKRPVVWIPRDKLGVSDDEIKRARLMSTVRVPAEKAGERENEGEKTNIWMSNEGTALDGKGRVVFRRSPPDFSNVDLIAL
ncbi:hypothetical protein LTR36_006237 [Oleoguttula mirabilis]|uniref:DUF221-domain-containing protein n=1 Tax=Oleoguttula mirabilis TaxID=1507867 RepID=A0AAV9JCD7_9PEZI|nr:hypothetical protein LTR36_006237 [Oleoguttula mirabilis]